MYTANRQKKKSLDPRFPVNSQRQDNIPNKRCGVGVRTTADTPGNSQK